PKCHPDTRVAVQTEIQSWAMDPNAPSIMWLYGPAGAGESAVAQTMADRWFPDSCLAAAFFFARGRSDSSGSNIFSTIAYQLALHFPALRRAFGLAVEGDLAICDKALEDQMYALIINPLTYIDPSDSGPHIILIDGLDECSDRSASSP
ncbi:hypothetical protein C8R46DRAFT_884999, partial [Mycena filopes]